MLYNFDELVNRRGSGSLKWDVKKNQLPMWVADMDFKTAPEIIESLKNRVEHGVFGYIDGMIVIGGKKDMILILKKRA